MVRLDRNFGGISVCKMLGGVDWLYKCCYIHPVKDFGGGISTNDPKAMYINP